jgi:hypothetical protein
LKKNGVNVNPVAVHRAMPPGDPIPAADVPRFADARDRAFASFGAGAPALMAESDVSTSPEASR